MTILLNDLLGIDDPRKYKLHLAARNTEGVHPLNVFVASRSEWLGWNQWRGHRNDWTRENVLSLMEYYPRSSTWLFGGVYEVMQRHQDRYELKAHERHEKYVGRLLVSFHRYQGMRGRAFYLEHHLAQMEVVELFPRAYSGESFPGFDHINHDFATLEAIFRTGRPDWKAALEHMKGVYVITDASNGRHYVGSAYGDAGIWSRWAAYVGTGHGWNDELVRLVRQKGPLYARNNFRFALLEVMIGSTPDETVIAREAHWKRVLMTREHGYNRN